jgi:hypothetical protein
MDKAGAGWEIAETIAEEVIFEPNRGDSVDRNAVGA